MPDWLLKLIWRFRRRGVVRLHLENADHSYDGVLLGVAGGHYVLAKPKMIAGPERTIALDGLLEVPRERVLCVQRF
jgi:hypothetical protein